MAEAEKSPIEKIRSGLLNTVIKPIGHHANSGVRGNLRRAREGAIDTNELAQEFERRFGVVSRLVAAIASKSTVSAEHLHAADPAQEKALDIAATVLNGTRNPNARDALETMRAIHRDAPPLDKDMTILRDQSAELREGLQSVAPIVEDAVNQSITDIADTFEPALKLAPQANGLMRSYMKHL